MAAVRLTRRYDANPAEVWDALTRPESVARWLAPASKLELEPGGTIELRFNPMRVDCRVRALESGRVLELDWHERGKEPSVVRFELVPDGEGTRLVLEHAQIPAVVGSAYAAGWTRHLDRFEEQL